MDKGQHLRLLITEGTSSRVIALSTNLQFHLSAATEDSTTKDTTDASGVNWNEYDITQRNGDIQVDALVAAGTDTGGETLNNVMTMLTNTLTDWELALVSGANNRVVSTPICSGKGLVSNVQVSAQNRNKATYSCTITIVGPVTVAS